MIRSFLKWPGGKARVMPELQKYLSGGDCLIEPFVGGATVFLNTDYRRYILGDINPDLINTYRVAKKTPDLLIDAVNGLFERHNTEEGYYLVRKRFNELRGSSLSFSLLSEVQRAAAFIYLNRHCFNGLMRYNRKGEFNTPYGKYKGVQYLPEQEIRLFAEKARDTKAVFMCCSFEQTIRVNDMASPVIYCDPPYLPASDTANFTEYYGGAFDADSHRQLAATLERVAKLGCRIVLSNSDTAQTREIYSQFSMREISVNRSISANAAKRAAAREVIATLKVCDCCGSFGGGCPDCGPVMGDATYNAMVESGAFDAVEPF